MSKNLPRRDRKGRFAPHPKGEPDISLGPQDITLPPEAVVQQLNTMDGLEPGSAAAGLKSPSGSVRASARVVGWDLMASVRQQFDATERQILRIVRPDLAQV